MERFPGFSREREKLRNQKRELSCEEQSSGQLDKKRRWVMSSQGWDTEKLKKIIFKLEV